MFVLNKRKRIEYRKNSKFLKVISLRTKRILLFIFYCFRNLFVRYMLLILFCSYIKNG